MAADSLFDDLALMEEEDEDDDEEDDDDEDDGPGKFILIDAPSPSTSPTPKCLSIYSQFPALRRNNPKMAAASMFDVLELMEDERKEEGERRKMALTMALDHPYQTLPFGRPFQFLQPQS